MNWLPEKPTRKSVNWKIITNIGAAAFAFFFAFCCAAKATSWAASGTDWLPLCLCYLVLAVECKLNADEWRAYAAAKGWFK